ncbi:uncharacterized protein LOC133206007 [Saccostrea echinata]|uniref:uncharacterized protein LOC133206007 n=1 Tax=Saccostrea echinata TaxID=191078 RepID=UPI002A818284|nr:uncharacterized protein LOC133206007 [Saccostrea echinata]
MIRMGILIMAVFNILIIESARPQTVDMLKSCGKNLPTENALLIEVNGKREIHGDKCTCTVKTEKKRHFLINIEKFTLGKGGNCPPEKPHLDFCINKTDCFAHECGTLKKSKFLPITANNVFQIRLHSKKITPHDEFLIVATSLYQAPCKPRDWKCSATDSYCINGTLLCDGHKNCPNGEDEDRWRCHPKQPMNIFLMIFLVIFILLVIFIGMPSLVLLKKVNCSFPLRYESI